MAATGAHLRGIVDDDSNDFAAGCLSCIASGLSYIGDAFKAVLRAIWWCIKAVIASGFNILAWSLDKFVLGAPFLRQYFAGGAFPNDLPVGNDFRRWMSDNSG